MEKKVSVIIPLYNCENTIIRCVNSLLKQTYSNYEIIIVDDGSTDNGYNKCLEQYGNESKVFILQKNNEGVSKARNYGIEKSHGYFITFVDSDDYVEPSYLKELVSAVEGYDLAICGIKRVSRLYKEKWNYHNFYVDDIHKSYAPIIDLYEHKILNSPCNKIYVRHKIRSLFDEQMEIGEDLIFNLNYISGIKSIHVINKILYVYDYTGVSTTHSFRKNVPIEQSLLFIRFYQSLLKIYPAIPVNYFSEQLSSIFDRYFLRPFDLRMPHDDIVILYKSWICNVFFKEAISLFNLEKFEKNENELFDVYNHIYVKTEKKFSVRIKKTIKTILKLTS